MTGLLRRTADRHGRLGGIFHAAGLARVKNLSDVTEATLAAELAPKVAGTDAITAAITDCRQNLHSSPDFVILFSSLAATLGGLGLSAYAAANRYLDAIAGQCTSHHPYGNGTTQWLSIAWDDWQFSYTDQQVAAYAKTRAPFSIPPDEGIAAIEALLAEVGTPPGITTQLTGLPLLLDRISNLLINDNLRTLSITALLVLFILYFYFKHARITAITLLAPLVSLIILAGGMVLLGIDITLTLAAVGVLMLGLGVDYSIHLAIHYHDERKRGQPHIPAILSTMRDLRIAITASFLTTLAGFSASSLASPQAARHRASYSALAIIIIYLVSLLLMPVLFILFGKAIDSEPNPYFKNITRLIVKLAVYQAKHPKTVLTATLLITVILFLGLLKVEFSTSNSNWIPEDDPLSLSFRESEWAFGAEEAVTIIITSERGDLRNTFTVRDIQRLTRVIENIPVVNRVESPFADIDLNSPDIQEKLTSHRAESFNKDFTLTTLRVYSSNYGQKDDGSSIMLPELRAAIAANPVQDAKVSLYGDLVRFDELGLSLQQDTAVTTLIGLVLVFLVVSLIYASIIVGITALLPIIIAVVWSIGLMGYTGVPFNSLSTGIVSLVLGIGADFSIHLVDGIRRHFSRGSSLQTAIEATLNSSGSAILLSSVTTLFGFIGLTGAILLGTQRLGISLAYSILAVFLVSISIVPAIMALRYRKEDAQRARDNSQ
ncbi:MAG: MMPL family transporter [Nitrosarchaeum sp.]|nr:MMPL family transporter [Nitrosarchaeum sp.]